MVVAVVDDSVAPAPLAGGANVTVTPETGLLPASRTVTWSGAEKAVLMAAVCVVPPVALICVTAPGVLVNVNVADAPPTEAMML